MTSILKDHPTKLEYFVDSVKKASGYSTTVFDYLRTSAFVIQGMILADMYEIDVGEVFNRIQGRLSDFPLIVEQIAKEQNIDMSTHFEMAVA